MSPGFFVFGGITLLRSTTYRSALGLAALSATAIGIAGQSPKLASIGQPLVEAVAHSQIVGPAPASTPVHLCVCLKMPVPGALEASVDDVSDPGSPNYRHFLTPDEIGQRFGQSDKAVGSVVGYLRQQGFTIGRVAKDHIHILADGTVGQAEAAFHVQLNHYRSLSPNENGHIDYMSYASRPQLPASLAPIVDDIEGLQTWNKGVPASCMTPAQASVLYNTAPFTTGNSAALGQGRTIGISSWDGFDLENTALFIQQFGLPTPPAGAISNISIETINGGSEFGVRLAEGDLDPQMVIGQAPLANVIIYNGAGGGDWANDLQVLNVYVTEEDDNNADIITESYAWALAEGSATAAHVVHQLMSLQGITYMAASGDDQNAEEQEYWYPVCEPEVLIVGGTSANVDQFGNRQSEVAWDSGSGGWSTIKYALNRLPSWQKGYGVPTQYNYRLSPDVAGHASGTPWSSEGAYYFYYYYSMTDGYIGTSFACPIFAGGLAVAEQQLVNLGKLTPDKHGHTRLGRIQNLIYGLNGDPSVFYDVTQGSNGYLPNGLASNAGPGWDFCTGWGAINWQGFVNAYPNPKR
jgi:subtilase family serine protease